MTEFLERVWQNGDIYKSDYEGFYCVDCEEYKVRILRCREVQANGGVHGAALWQKLCADDRLHLVAFWLPLLRTPGSHREPAERRQISLGGADLNAVRKAALAAHLGQALPDPSKFAALAMRRMQRTWTCSTIARSTVGHV